MDVSQVFGWAFIAIAVIAALALVAAAILVTVIPVLWLWKRAHAAGKDAALAQRAHITERFRMREVQTRAKMDEIAAKKRMNEASNDLAKTSLALDADLDVARDDAKARAKGILGQLDQRMRESNDLAKQTEERHHHELAALTSQLATSQERLNEVRQHYDDLRTREQQILSENAQLQQQRNGLQEQVADLRAYLSAAETKKPLDGHLMNMAKSMDDLNSKLKVLMAGGQPPPKQSA